MIDKSLHSIPIEQDCVTTNLTIASSTFVKMSFCIIGKIMLKNTQSKVLCHMDNRLLSYSSIEIDFYDSYGVWKIIE